MGTSNNLIISERLRSYDKRFSNISVFGAAGKMGSGIVLCLLQYISNRTLSGNNFITIPTIQAIDQSEEGLQHLISFLTTHLRKYAEKNIIRIIASTGKTKTTENTNEKIDNFIHDIISIVTVSTNPQSAVDSGLIFEATPEDPLLKTELLSNIHELTSKNPWIMSNTSSIPITELDKKAGLGGNIIGFHFYNPPAIQKLLEIIPSRQSSRELIEFSSWLARELGKTTVNANDIAGFAGNGIFIREVVFALKKVSELQSQVSWEEAVLTMDLISRDYLIRPMGIFQLIDYVGLDICISIAHIMQERLHEKLDVRMLEMLVEKKVSGGQFANGFQKNGIFKYEKNKQVAVYNPETDEYIPLKIEAWVTKMLGDRDAFPDWKILKRDAEAHLKLSNHFKALFNQQNMGAELAGEYLQFYKNTGDKLLEQQVVRSEEDVNQVIKLGFHHLFGPFNQYI